MSKNIQLIVSSTREGRFAPNLTEWVQKNVGESSQYTFEVVDLKDVDLPFYTDSASPMYQPVDTEPAKKWSQIISRGDAFVFLTAEYNRSIPAPLKNAIDFLYNEWLEKPAAIVSYGFIDGGKGASSHLLDILEYLKMDVAATKLSIQLSPDIFDESGAVKDPDATFGPYADELKQALDHIRSRLSA